MIQITRPAEPTVLKKNKSNWLTALNAALATSDKKKIKGAQGKYGHKDVKSLLEAMFCNKCAYCESIINVVTSGHIEHFHPKSLFTSKTFEWDNLLLSCPTCNNKQHKGDKFPTAIDGGPLVDPTNEDPQQHFKFIFDTTTKLATAQPTTTRGQTTAKIFGLNNRKALVSARSSLIKKLLALKTYELTDPVAQGLIADAKKQDQPYRAWVRTLI